MKKFQIRLKPDEATHFVEVARRCDFDIDIAYNRYPEPDRTRRPSDESA